MYNIRILDSEAIALAFEIEEETRELIKEIIFEKYGIP
jgi:hypothetical protein